MNKHNECNNNLIKHRSINGFTLVELVIVIAVIAILAAVLIPTFSHVIDKSNQSSDITLVRNINTFLELNTSINEAPADKKQLINDLKQYGITNTNNNSKSNNIYWSKSNNVCFIFNTKLEKITFPESCVNKTLDDFDDEVMISNKEITNLKYEAKKFQIPGTNNYLYCDGPSDGKGLTNKGTRVEEAGGFVTVGVIEIDVLEYESLTIYIRGVALRSSERDSYFRMHIFKESDYNDFTAIDNLYYGLTNDYWGFEVSEIDELYYKITFDMDKLTSAATNNGTVEKVYYALSLYGKGGNLVITHNEKINK